MCFDQSVSSSRNCASQTQGEKKRQTVIYFTRPAGKEPSESVVPVAVAKLDLVPSVQTGAGPGAVGDQSSTGGAVIHFLNCVCSACRSAIQCICNVGRRTKAMWAKCSHGSCVGWALGDSWLFVALPSSHASLPLVVRLPNCMQRQFCLLALPAEMKQKGKGTQAIRNTAN